MQDRQNATSWHRRFIIAAALFCGTILVLLTAVIIIAPKVINSGEVRSRIEAVVAKELHGSMTYDRVELSFFPRPHVVLHGLTIQVPGTMSAAIVTVRIHALLLPLFRGQFAVSSIALEHPEISVTVPAAPARHRTRKSPGKQPAGGSLDNTLTIAGRELPDLSIRLSQGRITILREGRELLSLGNLDASLAFVTDKQEGTADGTTSSDYHVTGTARATLRGTTALPAPLTVSIERFDAQPGSISVKSSRARMQDLDATVSGIIQGYLTASPRSDIMAHGTIGQESLDWIQTLAGMPDGMRLRAPLLVTGARLHSTGTGSTASRTLTVNAGKKNETTVSLVLHQEPGSFSIENLHVKDKDSDAEMKLSAGSGELRFSFTGNLMAATVDQVLERDRFSSGWMKGDLHIVARRDQWGETAVHGSLEGGQIVIPAPFAIPVTIDRFTVRADGTTVDLRPVVVSLGQDSLQMNGSASFSEDGVQLDLDVTTDRISLSELRALMERKTKTPGQHTRQGPGSNRKPDMSGNVRFQAAAFILDQYQADAVDMNVTFGKERTDATLIRSSVCGIAFTGTLRTAGSEADLSLKQQAQGKKLEESLPCIFRKDLGISGFYDLSGQISSRGTWDTLLRSLGGSFSLTASQGRIQSDHIVKGIIAYLNSTSLLKGSHAELLKEGVPFETISIQSTLRDGTLWLSEGVIKSRDLNIATEGNINLREGTLALNVLAAPFTRLDRLLGSVPIVKYIVGNALVVIPARVEGTFDHPNVRPLPVAGVGKDVTNLMKNVLHAPMKIIDPVIPKELEGKNTRPQE